MVDNGKVAYAKRHEPKTSNFISAVAFGDSPYGDFS
jgi:hypothetical protein